MNAVTVGNQLEVKLGERLLAAARESTRALHGYVPGRFYQMMSRYGPVETARRLVSRYNPTEGFDKLAKAGRLDLTVESIIYNNEEFHPLFGSAVLTKCGRRLAR
jgi:hypothetical protein